MEFEFELKMSQIELNELNHLKVVKKKLQSMDLNNSDEKKIIEIKANYLNKKSEKIFSSQKNDKSYSFK